MRGREHKGADSRAYPTRNPSCSILKHGLHFQRCDLVQHTNSRFSHLPKAEPFSQTRQALSAFEDRSNLSSDFFSAWHTSCLTASTSLVQYRSCESLLELSCFVQTKLSTSKAAREVSGFIQVVALPLTTCRQNVFDTRDLAFGPLYRFCDSFGDWIQKWIVQVRPPILYPMHLMLTRHAD